MDKKIHKYIIKNVPFGELEYVLKGWYPTSLPLKLCRFKDHFWYKCLGWISLGTL